MSSIDPSMAANDRHAFHSFLSFLCSYESLNWPNRGLRSTCSFPLWVKRWVPWVTWRSSCASSSSDDTYDAKIIEGSPSETTFDGASAGSRMGFQALHKFPRCPCTSNQFSHLAFLNVDMDFWKNKIIDYQRAFELATQQQYENKAIEEQMYFTCIHCCEEPFMYAHVYGCIHACMYVWMLFSNRCWAAV